MAPFDGDVTEHEALVQPKPDVFSVEAFKCPDSELPKLVRLFRGWLALQPPGERYEFGDVSRCALGQWSGINVCYSSVGYERAEFFYQFVTGPDHPDTFGAALSR